MNACSCSTEVTRILAKFMTELPKKRKCSIRTISKLTSINLYKYKEDGAFPLVSTFLKFCMSLNLEPGLMIYLACEVHKGDLGEKQAIEILAAEPDHVSALAVAYQIVIRYIQNS